MLLEVSSLILEVSNVLLIISFVLLVSIINDGSDAIISVIEEYEGSGCYPESPLSTSRPGRSFKLTSSL